MPLIEWIPEPKFGDREKREQDDLEYNSEPKVSLEEQKEQLRNELFGSFKQEDDPLANLEKKDDIIDPEDMVDPSLDVTEEDAQKEAYEMYSNNWSENNDYISWEEMHEDIESHTKTESEIIDEHNWSVDSMEDTWTEEEYNEAKEKLLDKQIDQWEKSPLIDGLVWQWFLTIDEWYIVKKALIGEGDMLDKINKIEWLDEEKKWQILDALQYVENSKENFIEKFNNNFSDEIDSLKSWEWKEKSLSEWQQRLLDKIWWNYFTVWAENWSTETTKEWLNRAMKTTLNEFINNKQFKEPGNFDNIKANILDWSLDFKTRFEQLQKIETQIVNSTASIIWKQTKAFKKWQEAIKNKEISKAEKVSEYKKAIEESIENNDKVRLQEIKEELDSFKEELPKWDAIESSVLDLINDVNEWLKEVN